MFSSRCRSDWMKEYALTWGDLLSYVFNYKEKSAEVVVVEGNEPMKGLEVSRISEGPNIHEHESVK